MEDDMRLTIAMYVSAVVIPISILLVIYFRVQYTHIPLNDLTTIHIENYERLNDTDELSTIRDLQFKNSHNIEIEDQVLIISIGKPVIGRKDHTSEFIKISDLNDNDIRTLNVNNQMEDNSLDYQYLTLTEKRNLNPIVIQAMY